MIHLEITVENAAELLASQAYGPGALLRWESSATQSGTYVEGGTVALVSGTSLYDVWDSAGVVGSWYRTRISNTGGTTFSAYSARFQGGTDPRPSMAGLIAKTRLAIGDPAGASQAFSDTEIQDALDARRIEVTECQLAWRPTTAQGGTVTYHDYYAPRGGWEDTVVIKDRTFAILTPDTEDLDTGHWAFTANVIPPVFVTGITYDVSGAAYDLLQTWASKVARNFDFVFAGQEYFRSQKYKGLLALSNEFGRTMLPRGMRPTWRADVGQW